MSRATEPRKRWGLSALVALAIALMAPTANAAAATVTDTGDSGPGTLRQLVADAKPGDTIELPPGRYDMTSGQILIEKDLTIAGAGAETTTLSANKASRIFRIEGAETEVTISGLTLRDGFVIDRDARFGVAGGAILSSAESLTLRDDVLVRNFINARSLEGVAVASKDRRLTIVDSTVVDNTGQADGEDGQSGGTIFGGAVSAVNDSARIVRTTISDNVVQAIGGQDPTAVGQNGGIISGAGLGTFVETAYEIVDSTISGNVGRALAGPGGRDGLVEGAGVFGFGTGPKQRIFNTTIAGNAAFAGTGKANGGGLVLSTFAGLETHPEVIGATIVANQADGTDPRGGGGNLAVQSNVAATFLNTIVADGVDRLGEENCHIASSEGIPGQEAPQNAKIVSLGFNLDSRDQCDFDDAGDLTETDPLLGPLADNGGPTLTLAPTADSPAVDAGGSSELLTDQRGLPRPVDLANPNSAADGADGSDIGAVELQR